MMLRKLPLSLAFATLAALGPAPPAAADNVVLEAGAQTRIEQAPILPEPAYHLGWNSADKSFWISGETPKPTRDLAGRVAAAGGTGTLGARYETFRDGSLSLLTSPVIRAEASWAEEGQPRHLLGGAVFQEMTLALPEGLKLRAKGGLGDPTGLSAAGGDSLPNGLAFRGEAAISGDLTPIAGPDTRFDLQVVSTRPVAGLRDSGFSAGCEMRLELSRKGAAPLGIGTSCPGVGGSEWITLNIGGRF
ncbi:hypothetical protein [Roseomonas indoligenes]|uniref:General secretion pathway protein N n=1 Tax=Roseomonas indoligenes TaxID=2820811 RepID=A0A940MZU4_9PROT|nr:hypothetical protein [Pararoseomonas indoligenes]MBP0493914.1 hypothetical protein [Pararoseomonas indoligenes]